MKLNRLSDFDARAELLACCGSTEWARRMAEARPFRDEADLVAAADRIWANLDPNDWLEAFRAHPRIGERLPPETKVEQRGAAAGWSAEEQSGAGSAPPSVTAGLREANVAYEARFGHIFIVCATGRSADEMLRMLNERMANDRATELRTAAEEQRKITRLRLQKLMRGS